MNKIIITIFFIISPLLSYSQTEDTERFYLNRTLSLKGDIPYEKYLAQELIKIGGEFEERFLRQLFAPKIIFQLHPGLALLDGSATLRIEVTRRKILVQYSSPNAANRALELLMTKIQQDGSGNYYIENEIIIELSQRNARLNNDFIGNFNPVSDIVRDIYLNAAQVNITFIEQQINQSEPDSVLTLYAVTNDFWELQSDVIQSSNVKWRQIIPDTQYSKKQIKQIIKYAEKRDIIIAISLSLGGDNLLFQEATGHKETTAEGMRFIRAMLEEWKRDAGCQYFIIDGVAKNDMKQRDFFKKMEELLEIKCEIK